MITNLGLFHMIYLIMLAYCIETFVKLQPESCYPERNPNWNSQLNVLLVRIV